jgi:hypothetical protein
MKNKIYLFIFYFIDLFTDTRVGNKNTDLIFIYLFNYIEKICERVIK